MLRISILSCTPDHPSQFLQNVQDLYISTKIRFALDFDELAVLPELLIRWPQINLARPRTSRLVVKCQNGYRYIVWI